MFIKRKGERAGTPKAKIEYGHPTHKDFNERLEARQAPRVVSTPIERLWLSAETLAQTPNLNRAFDLNRDPYIGAQRLDQRKTESQRRGEQTGRGSGMVEQDKAAPAFRPPEALRKSVDRQDFDARWMAELREAVMKSATSIEHSESRERPRAPVAKEPSR